jgi:hypothetical protein
MIRNKSITKDGSGIKGKVEKIEKLSNILKEKLLLLEFFNA